MQMTDDWFVLTSIVLCCFKIDDMIDMICMQMTDDWFVLTSIVLCCVVPFHPSHAVHIKVCLCKYDSRENVIHTLLLPPSLQHLKIIAS